MKILMMTENDPAGVAITFCNAINRYTQHTCRLITTASRYGFGYERDIYFPDTDQEDLEEIEQLLIESDLFHFHILFDEHRQIGPYHVSDYIKGKQIVHHHHGHPDFRANPSRYREKYRRLKRKILVSTPDLLKCVPFATWVPNPVPIYSDLFLPKEFSDETTIVLCQAPTRKDLKNTEEFIRVANDICSEFNHVTYKIVENTLYRECLKEKRDCHIHFDHMQGYYGVSSLESLSQGRPVIAGLDDYNIDHIVRFTDTVDIPWVIARNSYMLKQKIRELVCDHDLRHAIGSMSRTFMTDQWNEERVIAWLFEAYGIDDELKVETGRPETVMCHSTP